MKLLAICAAAFFSLALMAKTVSAQTFTPMPVVSSSGAAQLQALAKKIDEQNAKIDMLSQQILKLQQQLATQRPGVMIGEGAPANATSTPAPAAEASPKAGDGTTHIVARGETLTSIARMHNISVSELQKYNHIDNPLKLQAGQTLLIPRVSPSPAASPSGQ